MIVPTKPVIEALEFAKSINEEEVKLETLEGFFRIRNNDVMHHTGFELRIPEAKVSGFQKGFELHTIPVSLLKALYGVSAPELTIERQGDGQLRLVCGKREAVMHVLTPTSLHLFPNFSYEGGIKDMPTPAVTMKSDILRKELTGLLKSEPLSLAFELSAKGTLSLVTNADSGKVKTTFEVSDLITLNKQDTVSNFQLGVIKFMMGALSFAETVELFIGQNRPIIARLANSDLTFAYMAAPFVPRI